MLAKIMLIEKMLCDGCCVRRQMNGVVSHARRRFENDGGVCCVTRRPPPAEGRMASDEHGWNSIWVAILEGPADHQPGILPAAASLVTENPLGQRLAYSVGLGSKPIRRTMAPKSRLVRWLSARVWGAAQLRANCSRKTGNTFLF